MSQPENKPESTEFDQRVEIPNKCFGDGFPNRHKNIGDILGEKNKIGYDPSATSAKCRLCQCYCSRQLKVRLGGSWVEPLPISEKTRMQVRLHSNLDGSSLAHAIQVPMGPLQFY